MVGSWATFAFSTEVEPLLLPSPDDDPSSYLLYPPGFGPVEDWPIDGPNLSMLSVDSPAADPSGSGLEDADVVAGKALEEAAVGRSGLSDLLGLPEALSGKVSLVDGCASGFGEKDGVVDYTVIGGLDGSLDGEDDVCGSRAFGFGGISVACLEIMDSKEDGDGVGDDPPTVKTEDKVEREDADENITRNGVREHTPDVKAEVKVEREDVEATNLVTGGSSKSESDGSSSSSSSSSSEESSAEDDDSDEDEDGNDRNGRGRQKMDQVVDFEEGEIRDVNAEELAVSSDDDEGGGAKGPIRSKNELEMLPPVTPVNASLEAHHQTLPVGFISSVVGTKVIVEGIEEHSPLNEGSILWITETRSPLGFVDEIFGPVKNPYYVVRFNSEKEIPAGMSEGTAVSFVMEFANHIINDPSLYKKGYDASGDNDEELSDEVEFSDDEKEAEYKRSLRQGKRGTENRRRIEQESHCKKVQPDNRRFKMRNAGLGKGDDCIQSIFPQKGAVTSDVRNTARQFQPGPRQSSKPSGSSLARNQTRSSPQQTFGSGQVHVRRQPSDRCEMQTPAQPRHVLEKLQAPSNPSCLPGQIQPPPQPSFILGQLQGPFQQPCVPGQFQVFPMSFQQPCAPGQLGSAPLYVQGPPQEPTPPPCIPGPQVPFHPCSALGDATSFGAGQSNHSASPTMPAIPFLGQLTPPFDLGQQNLLMPHTNTLWATQQLITGVSGMFRNNGMPPHQQDLHLFHLTQNQLLPGFNNGVALQQYPSTNQGASPKMIPWQGSSPNPSAIPRTLDITAQGTHMNTGEVGGIAFSAHGQNHGQPSDIRPGRGDVHASMNFNIGNSSPRGRKPYGRGGWSRR